MIVTKAFFSSIMTTTSSFGNACNTFLNFISIYKKDYKNLNIAFKLSTILSKSIVLIYNKTLIKTADFAYFNRFKKYNKV